MQNDYSDKEKIFLKKTGININDGFNKKNLLSRSVTIIIPLYNNFKIFQKCFFTLQNQYIPDNISDSVELIIIDDGSTQKSPLVAFLQKENKLFNIKLLRFSKNHGRAAARNLGILHAKGEIIIFLDSDILATKYLIASHLLRHQFCKRIAVIGFRENINYRNNLIKLEKLRKGDLPIPDYKKDFRYKKFVPKSWEKIYKDVYTNQFGKTYFLLRGTKFFKNFTSTHGVWSLPFMFLSCNASIEKKEVIRVGGFDVDFKGWGAEDTYFAYKLIKNNILMIPVISATCFHLKPDIHKYTKQKIQNYKRNLALYKIKTRIRHKIYGIKEWKNGMKDIVKGEYNLTKIIPKK